jgi:hypothetical protein
VRTVAHEKKKISSAIVIGEIAINKTVLCKRGDLKQKAPAGVRFNEKTCAYQVKEKISNN